MNRNTKTSAAKVDGLLRRAHQRWREGKLRSAFYLFIAAAKLGDVTAQLDLGYFYDVGIGLKPNRLAALQWYKRAYRRGHCAAANNIGTIFRDEGDTRQALLWFERAVKLGDIDANLEIAKILLQETKRDEDAVPYLERVAKAKAGEEVTKASLDEAVRLLKVVHR